MRYYPHNFGSREELDLELEVIEGELPEDLGGYVFVNSVAGTVNFATPAPRDWPDGSPCEEYGASGLNGDGLLYRFDFSEMGTVRIKSRLLKTPCFYADQATRYGTEYHQEGLHFISKGLSRVHNDLGSRNQVNTAIVPFKFSDDAPVHLAVTFDAGPPYLVNPLTLELVTPIGRQPEWMQQFPDEMEQLFPMVYATAHPCFDPYTRDFYAVNYQKSLVKLMVGADWGHRLREAADFLFSELQRFADWVLGRSMSSDDLVDAIRQFIPFVNNKHETNHKEEFNDHYRVPDGAPVTSELRLVHWRGGKLNSWTVVDQDNGVPVSITQTVHQTDLTEDYVVISDSTLKFAMDLLLSLPFGHHDRLNDLLRRMLTHTIRSTTPCYLIRRADLKSDAEEIPAVRCELPYETIHFSLDYRNPDNRITLYAGHNSAICGGEWIRPFDRLATDPDQAPPADRIGSMATSMMDISRLGHHVIDANSGEIVQSRLIHQKGFTGDRVDTVSGPHTWGAGLYTYRNEYAAERRPDRLRHIYQQFDGLDAQALTKFVYDLYEGYNRKHGLIPAEKLLEYHRHGIPGCLCRVEVETMELADHYTFARHEQLLSLQFIPRRWNGEPASELDPQQDGYIAGILLVGDPTGNEAGYSRQLYLFDAADLTAGPVCKLSHDDLAWGMTIHSAYCDSVAEPTLDYRVDIAKDYDWVLDQFVHDEKREKLRSFFAEEVLPHYRNGGAQTKV